MVVKHLGLVRATVLLSPIVAGCGSGAPAGYVGGEGDLSVATGPSSTATSMMVPSSATSAALNPTLPPGGAVVSPAVTDAAKG